MARAGWIAILVLFSGCAHSPYYRVFRGVKRGELARTRFTELLESRFIPALPAAHSKDGLLSYLPALPPASGMPAGFPDELALVVYASKGDYDSARSTDRGQAYAAMHWEVFDRQHTKSGSTQPFRGAVEAETPYDVFDKAVDWSNGHTVIFVGKRRPSADPAKFLDWLAGHVKAIAGISRREGLRGYVFVANKEWEIAYQNWASESEMERALRLPEAKAALDEASVWMIPVFQAATRKFEGRARAGELYLLP